MQLIGTPSGDLLRFRELMKTNPAEQAPAEPQPAGPTRLRGEIVTIGDELNRGEIVDTNAAWLAERLSDPELGIHVRFRQGVNDHPEELGAVLRQAASRSQVVVISGGLGPTTDDLTVEVAGRAGRRRAHHGARARAAHARPLCRAQLRSQPQ